MSVLDYLEKLKTEPEGKRRQFAIVFSLAATGIIAIAWLLFVTGTSSYFGTTTARSATSSPLSVVQSYLSVVSDAVGNFTASLGNAEYSATSTSR